MNTRWIGIGWAFAATVSLMGLLLGDWAAAALPIAAMAYATERSARARAERLMRLAFEDAERVRASASELGRLITGR